MVGRGNTVACPVRVNSTRVLSGASSIEKGEGLASASRSSRAPSLPFPLAPLHREHLSPSMLGRSKSLRKSASLSPMPIEEEGSSLPPLDNPSVGGRSSSPAPSSTAGRRLGETLHAPTGLVNGALPALA